MNHEEAVRLQATEKYVLGELSHTQREEYEDHYFDCPECAFDLKAAAAFVDTSREVFKAEAEKVVAAPAVAGPGGWFNWLRPMVAVPAFAVLLVALGYQSFVSLPHWKNAAMQSAAPRMLPMYSLIAANARGPESGSLTFHVRPEENFGLYVDVPVDSAYSTYLLQLESPDGHSMILSSVSYAEAQKTQVVVINAGRRAGAYQIVVLGLAGRERDLARGTTLATLKFNVDFIN